MNDPTPIMFDDDALDAARARNLKVLGGVAALAAMAAVAVSAVVFTSPDAGTSEAAAPVPAAATADPVTAPETGTGTTDAVAAADGDEPPRTFEVFSSKNPFEPLVDTTPEVPAASTPVGTPTAVPVTGTTTNTLVPETTTTTAPVRSTEPTVARRVEVVDIFTNAAGALVANVRVNDTVHQDLAEGAAFAGNYKVVSLSQVEKCGSFLYGDDTFRLCVGEQILK